MTRARRARNGGGEIARLRARLTEAEDTLKAIRSGDIDAIAVDGPRGRQIFTLQSADEPYRVLVEGMNEGAASMTADGTILFCNGRLAQMLDNRPEKLVGASVLAVVAPRERERFKRLLAHSLQGNARSEIQFQRRDGGLTPALVALKAIPSDQELGLCMVATDLTERKSAEDQMRASSLYTRKLIEASLDPLVTISSAGKITDVNEATETVTGVSRDKMIGSDFCDYFTEPEKARQGYQQVFEQGTVRDYPLAIRHLSGSLTDVLYNATVYRNEAGEVQGVFAAARDVSERKRAEEKLRERAALLDLAHDAIILRGLDGRILMWSRSATDTYGFSVEEAVGRIAQDLLKTVFPIPIEDIQSWISKTREWEGELGHTRRDGAQIVVASRWSLLRDDQGKATAILEINRDITARKKAEGIAAAEREKFNRILDNLPPYVVLLTPDYHVAFANREFRRRFGESGGQRCYEFLFGLSQPCEVCHTFEVLKTGGPVNWQWTGPDGRQYDIHDFPFIDTDGSRLILEMGIDVTERKRAEEALRTASLYTRNLIEASLDPLVTISSEGKITDVNQATEEVTGVPRAKLIGSDFSDYFTEPEKARQGYQQVFEHGMVTDYPLAIRHVSGRITHVVYNASVYKSDAGQVQGVFAAARDISERKLAEERLRTERKRFEDVLDGLPALVCILTPDHDVAFANRAFMKEFGESRGRKCYEYCFGRTAPCEFCEAFQALETKRPHEWELGSARGRRFRVFDMPFQDEKGSPAVLEMNIDVTEQRQAEEALALKAQELVRSNEELAQFAYVASHDLQEPLRKIGAFGDRLAAHTGNALDEQGREYLERMLNAASRMSQLIEGLLELSRVTTRTKALEPVDLNQVLSDVLSDLEVRIQQSGGQADIEQLPTLMADRLQMHQLFQNLIGNALKFHKEGVPPVIRVHAERSAKAWEIHVEDNGIGFEEQYLTRMFRPFQRLNPRSAYEGSGMGLAICSKIVNGHFGQIMAHSQLGVGSDFIVVLPGTALAKEAKAS